MPSVISPNSKDRSENLGWKLNKNKNAVFYENKQVKDAITLEPKHIL